MFQYPALNLFESFCPLGKSNPNKRPVQDYTDVNIHPKQEHPFDQDFDLPAPALNQYPSNLRPRLVKQFATSCTSVWDRPTTY